MGVRIFTTGGTIDKVYFDAKSSYQVGDPQIGELLAEANVTVPYAVTPLLRKDSLEIGAADRALIAERVAAAAESQVLITHGTDTMIDTARALLGIEGKTVVLVGAMQPARLRVSDAFFNIGFALAAVQLLPPGIYVAMNGRVFNPLTTCKNVAESRFEQVVD
ncbi:MAG: asparaginase [Gammaproteobacteria bacterium]|nr:MAG: asparaginase [Gammaproteobacteria bacterium]